MPQCPRCYGVYDDHVRHCPNDGTALIALDRTLPASAEQAAAAVVATLPRDEDALAPGSVVGEYRITGKIGAGGMGTVFAGVHPVIGKRVAVKVLNTGLSEDSQVVQRFIQEARAVNQIGHRNIVDIFAFGQLTSGRHYFVMEFLSGMSLYERMSQQPPLSYADCFTILLEVTSALAAAHAEGIVHRDLKPENIFLAESKTGERAVKLLDFGIAKLLRPDGNMQRTRTGVPLGTPLYMSPEQCLGQPVDARTDIYALGVVMFELFTGQVPFPGPSYIETVNGHLSQPPPPPTEFVDIPGELEALVLSCLAKDPTARPQTVKEIRQRLKLVAQSMGVDDVRRTTAGRASGPALTPIRRSPVPRSTGSPPPPAPVTGDPRGATVRKASGRPLVIGVILATLAALGVTAVALRKHAQSLQQQQQQQQQQQPAPSTSLTFDVTSEPPDAVVLVDGARQAERTPTTLHLPRAAAIRVAVEKHGYARFETVLHPDANERQPTVLARLTATREEGGLHARSNVSATWRLDGRIHGEDTSELRVEHLAPGPHVLRVEAKGYEPHEEEVDIRPDRMSTLPVELAPVVAAQPRHGGGREKHGHESHERPGVEDPNATHSTKF